MNQAPESIRTGWACAFIGVACLAYVLEDKGAVLSTAASAMALVINGAR